MSEALPQWELAPRVIDAPPAMTSESVCAIFDQLFSDDFNTRLVAGGEEPFYQASREPGQAHRVIFRHDYVASALHEVAHWCIAGCHRRAEDDYGYWYSPDGRDSDTQRAFERVEARPQALEWLFSDAAGLTFQVSVDNLDGNPDFDAFPFKLAVWQMVQQLIRVGLPPRAAAFREALAAAAGRSYRPLCAKAFQLGDLC
ncbi:elongation factor P hydroxylase [Spongiibacter taiwanensis]|uniref:elongation factor P hydroxylase n=1 Tax=Spongiibacter taiwanensis TaxID=1748242 RepID=UPI00203634E1|nr:elongation factor P hydroxylase [Spongiibacter taiwanensis]USA43294.1 elongation factor P hydroxylase [Spongiibacter taiwanensis]